MRSDQITGITKKVGSIDAPALIDKLNSLGVGEDIELVDSGISIPKSIVPNIAILQKELGSLSKMGNSFNISEEGERLVIHTFQPYYILSVNHYTLWNLRTEQEQEKLWHDLKENFTNWIMINKSFANFFEINEKSRCILLGDLTLLPRKVERDFLRKVSPGLFARWNEDKPYQVHDTVFLVENKKAQAKKEEELISQLEKEQHQFAVSYVKPIPKDVKDFIPVSKTSVELIDEINKNEKIQFIIVADASTEVNGHGDPATWLWLNKYKNNLYQAGFKMMAMEFYAIWQQNDLDSFYKGETKKPPKTLSDIRRLM